MKYCHLCFVPPWRNSLLAHQILTTVHETIVNGFWTLHLIQHFAGSRDLHLPQPNKLQKKVPLAHLWSFVCKDPTLGTSKPYTIKNEFEKKKTPVGHPHLPAATSHKDPAGQLMPHWPKTQVAAPSLQKIVLGQTLGPKVSVYGFSRSERGLLHVAIQLVYHKSCGATKYWKQNTTGISLDQSWSMMSREPSTWVSLMSV